MKLWKISAVVLGAVAMSLPVSALAQGSTASDQPPPVTHLYFQLTMMRIIPDPDETLSGNAVPYSCYRVGRCSAYDLYYFRDRPNRLTRLAPEAPAESSELPPFPYLWFFAPVTPEENILPEYRSASQVRDEYRAVGRPIDLP